MAAGAVFAESGRVMVILFPERIAISSDPIVIIIEPPLRTPISASFPTIRT
jgi:hypothetical protein